MSYWIIILAILGGAIITFSVIWFIVVNDVKKLAGDPKKKEKKK